MNYVFFAYCTDTEYTWLHPLSDFLTVFRSKHYSIDGPLDFKDRSPNFFHYILNLVLVAVFESSLIRYYIVGFPDRRACFRS